MNSIIDLLVKRSLSYLELKDEKAPSIILQEEENFLDKTVKEFTTKIKQIVEEMKDNELKEMNNDSPCYACNNINSNQQCEKKHCMDETNISKRIAEGCNDFIKSTVYPNIAELRYEQISKKYSSAEMKTAFNLIIEKMLKNL